MYFEVVITRAQLGTLCRTACVLNRVRKIRIYTHGAAFSKPTLLDNDIFWFDSVSAASGRRRRSTLRDVLRDWYRTQVMKRMRRNTASSCTCNVSIAQCICVCVASTKEIQHCQASLEKKLKLYLIWCRRPDHGGAIAIDLLFTIHVCQAYAQANASTSGFFCDNLFIFGSQGHDNTIIVFKFSQFLAEIFLKACTEICNESNRRITFVMILEVGSLCETQYVYRIRQPSCVRTCHEYFLYSARFQVTRRALYIVLLNMFNLRMIFLVYAIVCLQVNLPRTECPQLLDRFRVLAGLDVLKRDRTALLCTDWVEGNECVDVFFQASELECDACQELDSYIAGLEANLPSTEVQYAAALVQRYYQCDQRKTWRFIA